MSVHLDGASNKPLERPAARIRSLAAAHWRRWADGELRQSSGRPPEGEPVDMARLFPAGIPRRDATPEDAAVGLAAVNEAIQ